MGLRDFVARLVGRSPQDPTEASTPRPTVSRGSPSPTPLQPDPALVSGIRRRTDPRTLGLRVDRDAPSRMVAVGPGSFSRLSRTSAPIASLPLPIGEFAGTVFRTSLSRLWSKPRDALAVAPLEFRWLSEGRAPAFGGFQQPAAASRPPVRPSGADLPAGRPTHALAAERGGRSPLPRRQAPSPRRVAPVSRTASAPSMPGRVTEFGREQPPTPEVVRDQGEELAAGGYPESDVPAAGGGRGAPALSEPNLRAETARDSGPSPARRDSDEAGPPSGAPAGLPRSEPPGLVSGRGIDRARFVTPRSEPVSPGADKTLPDAIPSGPAEGAATGPPARPEVAASDRASPPAESGGLQDERSDSGEAAGSLQRVPGRVVERRFRTQPGLPSVPPGSQSAFGPGSEPPREGREGAQSSGDRPDTGRTTAVGPGTGAASDSGPPEESSGGAEVSPRTFVEGTETDREAGLAGLRGSDSSPPGPASDRIEPEIQGPGPSHGERRARQVEPAVGALAEPTARPESGGSSARPPSVARSGGVKEPPSLPASADVGIGRASEDTGHVERDRSARAALFGPASTTREPSSEGPTVDPGSSARARVVARQPGSPPRATGTGAAAAPGTSRVPEEVLTPSTGTPRPDGAGEPLDSSESEGPADARGERMWTVARRVSARPLPSPSRPTPSSGADAGGVIGEPASAGSGDTEAATPRLGEMPVRRSAAVSRLPLSRPATATYRTVAGSGPQAPADGDELPPASEGPILREATGAGSQATGSIVSAETGAGGEGGEEGEEQDVDKIAEAVLRKIKQRLKVERERERGSY